jgi:hypothetical protein
LAALHGAFILASRMLSKTSNIEQVQPFFHTYVVSRESWQGDFP